MAAVELDRMRIKNSIRLMTWHRRFGLAAVTVVLLSSFSGVLHPIMVYLQPAPVTSDATLQLKLPAEMKSIGEVLASFGAREVIALRLVMHDGIPAYQIHFAGESERRYVNAVDGGVVTDGDRRYAEQLARIFLGDPYSAIAGTTEITRFDHEYSYINRVLPVWRVQFERPDGMRVFVDTAADRIGALADRTKAALAFTFVHLHRWQWLESIAPTFRLVFLAIVFVAALLTMFAGTLLYISRRKNPARGVRRAHRWVGITVALFALAFAVSGLIHLLYKGLRGDAAQRFVLAPVALPVAKVVLTPADALKRARKTVVRSIALVAVEAEPWYRIEPDRFFPQVTAHHGAGAHHAEGTGSGGAVYVSAVSGRLLYHGETRHAVEQARRVPGASAPIETVKRIDQFNEEYDFSFKRLPVERIALADGRAVFVDIQDGTVAAVIDGADRSESWIFNHIHKGEWLAALIGGNLRDAVAMALALSVALASLLGLMLYGEKIWPAKTRKRSR